MKQIGWKFKEGCEIYRDAAIAIATITNLDPREDGTLFSTDSHVTDCLKEAKILDLWFEPVYEEEYKVGDWIYVKETGTAVYMSSNHGCATGHIAQIERMDSMYGSATQEDPRYYGFKFNLRREDFRKATTEEIEKAKSLVKISGYKAEKTSSGIKFGCQTIPYSVLDSLENLMSRSEFSTDIKINNTPITLEIVQKLKNL